MSFQGVEFTPEMREMVVNVKVFFDDFKLSLDKQVPPATKLTASAIGVSIIIRHPQSEFKFNTDTN